MPSLHIPPKANSTQTQGACFPLEDAYTYVQIFNSSRVPIFHESPISQWCCFNTHRLFYSSSKYALHGAPIAHGAQQQGGQLALALEGTLCIHHSEEVPPPLPSQRAEKFIYSGTNCSGSLAYLGRLPIHHRRAELSRHECLFYEHLHSMNAQTKMCINARTVHMAMHYIFKKRNIRCRMAEQLKTAPVRDLVMLSSKTALPPTSLQCTLSTQIRECPTR